MRAITTIDGYDKRKRHTAEYIAFLRSDRWRELSAQRMAIDGYRCTMCGATGTRLNRLECHHLNYKQPFGEENPYRDLTTLCHVCHVGIHTMMRRITSSTGQRGWRDAFGVPLLNSTDIDDKGET